MANETQDKPRELQTREKPLVESEGTRPGAVFRPDVDIVETADAFLVTADLPGVDDKHVDVRLEKGVLTIDATLASLPEQSWTPLHTEYQLGGYHREFRLSEAIDADRISGRMQDGVLELQLPKSEKLRPRQITVQSA